MHDAQIPDHENPRRLRFYGQFLKRLVAVMIGVCALGLVFFYFIAWMTFGDKGRETGAHPDPAAYTEPVTVPVHPTDDPRAAPAARAAPAEPQGAGSAVTPLKDPFSHLT